MWGCFTAGKKEEGMAGEEGEDRVREEGEDQVSTGEEDAYVHQRMRGAVPIARKDRPLRQRVPFDDHRQKHG